jgi:23S rRNA (uridine2552-2'-O)-methyltransferase
VPKKKSSSRAWLREHINDPWVQQAQKDGYRSRASYKLLELQRKDRLFSPGYCVLDLGAAPGGWSQVAAQLVGDQGRVLATDILPMDALPGVDFVQGDFTQQAVFDALLEKLGTRPVDVVTSDMAPNLSGLKAVDQPAAMYLVELALDMALRVLGPRGVLVAKIFHGEGFDTFLRELRKQFVSVAIRKPDASRPRSRETYLVARGPREAS